MTELENTKTDLNYTNKQLKDANEKNTLINEEVNKLHLQYQEIISTYENEKSSMKDKLENNLIREVKVKQMEAELQNLKSNMFVVTPRGGKDEETKEAAAVS